MERKDALFRATWFLMGSIAAVIVAYLAGLVGPTPSPEMPIAPIPALSGAEEEEPRPPMASPRISSPTSAPPKPPPPQLSKLAPKKPSSKVPPARSKGTKSAPPNRPPPPKAPPTEKPQKPERTGLDRLFDEWNQRPGDIDLRTRIEATLERAADQLPDRNQSVAVKSCVSSARLSLDGRSAYTLLLKCRTRLKRAQP